MQQPREGDLTGSGPVTLRHALQHTICGSQRGMRIKGLRRQRTPGQVGDALLLTVINDGVIAALEQVESAIL